MAPLTSDRSESATTIFDPESTSARPTGSVPTPTNAINALFGAEISRAALKPSSALLPRAVTQITDPLAEVITRTGSRADRREPDRNEPDEVGAAEAFSQRAVQVKDRKSLPALEADEREAAIERGRYLNCATSDTGRAQRSEYGALRAQKESWSVHY